MRVAFKKISKKQKVKSKRRIATSERSEKQTAKSKAKLTLSASCESSSYQNVSPFNYLTQFGNAMENRRKTGILFCSLGMVQHYY